MARTNVAMKMWLSIVGAAKRDGHDAVSHRHGTYVDFIQHGLSEKFLQLDTEIATRHSADIWLRRSSAGHGTVPMMDGGPRGLTHVCVGLLGRAGRSSFIAGGELVLPRVESSV